MVIRVWYICTGQPSRLYPYLTSKFSTLLYSLMMRSIVEKPRSSQWMICYVNQMPPVFIPYQSYTLISLHTVVSWYIGMKMFTLIGLCVSVCRFQGRSEIDPSQYTYMRGDTLLIRRNMESYDLYINQFDSHLMCFLI